MKYLHTSSYLSFSWVLAVSLENKQMEIIEEMPESKIDLYLSMNVKTINSELLIARTCMCIV